MHACSEAAVVGQANFLAQPDADDEGHRISYFQTVESVQDSCHGDPCPIRIDFSSRGASAEADAQSLLTYLGTERQAAGQRRSASTSSQSTICGSAKPSESGSKSPSGVASE